MNNEIFVTRFNEAIKRTVEKARKVLVEDVPNEYLYIIETVDMKRTEPMSKDEAISIFYKEGKVSRWININLETVDNNISLIKCEIAPDYFEHDSELLYEEEGIAPFRVGFPPIPEPYREGKKFNIKELRSDYKVGER